MQAHPSHQHEAGPHLQLCTGRSSMAPALALETTEVSGEELRWQVSTPEAPRK